MLIVMKAGATRDEVAAVEARIRELGFTPNEVPGSTRLAIGITGNQGPLDPGLFNVMTGVAEAVPISRPWKLVSREVHPHDTIITTPTCAGPYSDLIHTEIGKDARRSTGGLFYWVFQ